MNSNHSDASSTAAPCVMVIFGGTGDLTKRKLLPALLNLSQENVLSKQFAIIGVAGNDSTTESFRKNLTAEMPQFAPDPIDLKMWDWLVERIYYVRGDFGDPETYKRLQAQIDEVDKTHGCHHCRAAGRRGHDQGRKRQMGQGDCGEAVWPRFTVGNSTQH